MALLTTADDLKTDALNLAGEPTGGTSQYEDEIYDWLNVVQRAIVSGGTFGSSTLEPLDWTWARAYPRGTIQLVQPFNQGFTLDAVFVPGSNQVTVLGVVTQDLTHYRIARADVPARHLILSQQVPGGPPVTILTLQDPWTGPNDIVDDWWAYPDTYTLPTDFVRGCSPLFVAGGPGMTVGPLWLDVVEPTQLEADYPTAAAKGGMPLLAARVDERRLRFSHYLDTPSDPDPVQIEFEYIRRPPPLLAGGIPLLPLEHRRVLSYGAAYLIMVDKDDPGASALWGLFQMQWKAMRDEDIRSRHRMSSRWGVVQPPRALGQSIWRTTSGLPVFAW